MSRDAVEVLVAMLVGSAGLVAWSLFLVRLAMFMAVSV